MKSGEGYLAVFVMLLALLVVFGKIALAILLIYAIIVGILGIIYFVLKCKYKG